MLYLNELQPAGVENLLFWFLVFNDGSGLGARDAGLLDRDHGGHALDGRALDLHKFLEDLLVLPFDFVLFHWGYKHLQA